MVAIELELLTRGAWRTCHMRMRGSFPYFLVSLFLVSVSHFSVPTFSVTQSMTTKPAQTHVYIFWVVHLLAG